MLDDVERKVVGAAERPNDSVSNSTTRQLGASPTNNAAEVAPSRRNKPPFKQISRVLLRSRMNSPSL